MGMAKKNPISYFVVANFHSTCPAEFIRPLPSFLSSLLNKLTWPTWPRQRRKKNPATKSRKDRYLVLWKKWIPATHKKNPHTKNHTGRHDSTEKNYGKFWERTWNRRPFAQVRPESLAVLLPGEGRHYNILVDELERERETSSGGKKKRAREVAAVEQVWKRLWPSYRFSSLSPPCDTLVSKVSIPLPIPLYRHDTSRNAEKKKDERARALCSSQHRQTNRIFKFLYIYM